jgi:phage-related protein
MEGVKASPPKKIKKPGGAGKIIDYYSIFAIINLEDKPMVEIEYFHLPSGKEPVKDFVNALPAKDRSRIFRGLFLLEEFWPRLGQPHVKNVTGEPGLWELRVEGDRKTFRIFFGHGKGKIVLLHAIIKKGQRIPLKDIRLAAERLRLWKEV